jgi:hypothetical protein
MHERQAIALRETSAGLRRYTVHALGFVVCGLALLIGGGAFVPAGGDGGSPAIAVPIGLGLLGVGFGISTLFNAARMWRHLRRHPWRTWPSRFHEVGGGGTLNGNPTLVLGSACGDEFVLAIVSTKWRWRRLDACDGGDVWLAGDPRAGGVVARPGGTCLLWARRPRLAERREMLRRQVVGQPRSPSSGGR